MSMHVHSDSRSGRFGRRSGYRAMSEINVTPFVDVMLVLLIIFMVTAPLLTTGVQVDLPDGGRTPIPGNDEPITLSMKKDGSIWYEDTAIELSDLQTKLAAISEGNPEVRVFVRGDKDVDYGLVMNLLSSVYASGYKKVSLITTPASDMDQTRGN